MQSALRRPLSGRRVHFIGIGGVGMAALAELLLRLDYEVTGSDLKSSKTVQRLLGLGISVQVGTHRASSVDGADHVIVSAAVPEANPEVRAALDAGAEVISRADLLGRIFDAGRGAAVTGTHGKTTTASMLARAMQAAGADPSFLIGGDINDVGSGAHLGGSDLVVAEADEAFGSFLSLHPALAVVTNVDLDHPEHYAGQDEIDDAFITFLSQRRDAGVAVVCGIDEGVTRILPRVSQPIVRYGWAGSGCDVEVDAVSGVVTRNGDAMGELRLQIPGAHNLLNATAAFAAAVELGGDSDMVLDGLRSFAGVERRFSIRGTTGGVTVVDDYAHNPRKVSAALAAAREAYPGHRVVALFQPHLYLRTQQLGDRFGTSFDDADIVVVTDVYGAREEPLPGVSGRIVSDAIKKHRPGANVLYVPRLEEAAGIVAGLVREDDVVMTLGAGDVTTAAARILALLAAPDGATS